MILKSVILLVCIVSMVSCGFSGGQIPADHYYRLPEAAASKSIASVFKNLKINPVKVEGLYHERSILYVEKLSPLEVKRYHYHYWVETPEKLVHKFARQYLLQSGISQNILNSASHSVPDVEVAMTITHFERIIDHEGAQILINLNVSVSGNHLLMQEFSRPYTAKVKAADNTMHTTVEGFGLALNDIMAAFLKDLSENTKNN